MLSPVNQVLPNLLGIGRETPRHIDVTSLHHTQDDTEERDLIDYAIYHEAISRLFPAEHFNVIVKTKGQTKERTVKWYQFAITRRISELLKEHKGSTCHILISRTYAASREAFIKTTFKGEPAFFEKTTIKPRFNCAERITHALIDGFYRLSKEQSSMTSSSHRALQANLADLSEEKTYHPAKVKATAKHNKVKRHKTFIISVYSHGNPPQPTLESQDTKVVKAIAEDNHVEEHGTLIVSACSNGGQPQPPLEPHLLARAKAIAVHNYVKAHGTLIVSVCSHGKQPPLESQEPHLLARATAIAEDNHVGEHGTLIVIACSHEDQSQPPLESQEPHLLARAAATVEDN